MFGYFSTIQTSKNEETLSLLHHPSKRLPYKRWIIFSAIFLFAFTVSSFTLYSLRYCSIHQCMMYNPSKTDGITVVPSIGLRLSWLHIFFGLFYVLLLSITISLRGPVHWYVMPLLLFVGFQFTISTYKLMVDGNTYIREQLDDSWQRAYESEADAVLLEQLQTRLECQGFADRLDRNMFLTTNNDIDEIEPCLNKLMSMFGSGIYAWGVTLWVLKLVQMIGLSGCYSAYLRMNQQVDDIEERERVQEKGSVSQ